MGFAALLVLSGFHESMMYSNLTHMSGIGLGSFGGMAWAQMGSNMWTYTIFRVVVVGVPGWGLYTLQRWSRWAALVMCVLMLFLMKPFGALLAIFTVYTLLRRGTVEGFRQAA